MTERHLISEKGYEALVKEWEFSIREAQRLAYLDAIEICDYYLDPLESEKLLKALKARMKEMGYE